MNEEEEQEEQGDLMIVGREEVKMIEEGVKMNKEEHEFEDCLLHWTTEGKHYQSIAKFRGFYEVDWRKEVEEGRGDGVGGQQQGGGDAGGARLHRRVQFTCRAGRWSGG